MIGLRSELAEEGIGVSIRWLCEVLGIPRASVYREPRQRSRYAVNESLATEIKGVIDQNPSFGVRRILCALNRNRQNRVNVKAVRRIVKAKGWIMAKRPKGLRPRCRHTGPCDRLVVFPLCGYAKLLIKIFQDRKKTSNDRSRLGTNASDAI